MQPPAAPGVDKCRAGRRNFTRAWPLVLTVPGDARLGIAAATEFLTTDDEKRPRRDVVEKRIVIQRVAARDLSTHFDRISLAEMGAGLYLKPAQARPPAIPEEEEIGDRLVPLDEVGDPIVIEVDAKLGAAVRVARRKVELQTGFGLEAGIPGDEAASGWSAEVSIRQNRIAEASRDCAVTDIPLKDRRSPRRIPSRRHRPSIDRRRIRRFLQSSPDHLVSRLRRVHAADWRLRPAGIPRCQVRRASSTETWSIARNAPGGVEA